MEVVFSSDKTIIGLVSGLVPRGGPKVLVTNLDAENEAHEAASSMTQSQVTKVGALPGNHWDHCDGDPQCICCSLNRKR